MEFGIRPIEGGTQFSDTLEQVIHAEEVGFNSVWFAEHYTPDDQWWPASLLNLSAAATRTSEIQLGSNIIIAPFYHPVWLANAGAMLDIISDGRFIAGLGLGYDPVEFNAMGIDLDDRIGRTIENIILLKKLWTEESVTYEGNYFEVEEYGIAPKPLQDPRPEIWLGVWGEYLLSQAAKRADAWIPGAVANKEALSEKNAIYKDKLQTSATSRPLLRDIIVEDTEQEALATAKKYLHKKYSVYESRGHQFFTDYSGERFEEFAQDRIIYGTPQQCIDEIADYQDQFGIDHLLLRFVYPGMPYDESMTRMDRIADDILPSFR